MSGLSSSLPRDDAFPLAIQKLLDCALPASDPQPDAPDPIDCPLTFYDRHIASNLILKSIKIAPSLPETLTHHVRVSVSQFFEKGYKFPSSTFPRLVGGQGTRIRFAYSVGCSYAYTVGNDLAELAAKIIIYPDIPEWYPVLVFVPGDYEGPLVKSFFKEGRPVPDFYSIPSPDEFRMKELMERLPAQRLEVVRDMPKLNSWLACWTFFASTRQGRSMVADMPYASRFDWASASTEGASAHSTLPSPPDAPDGLSWEYVQSLRSTRSRSSQSVPKSPYSGDIRQIKVPPWRPKGAYKPASKDYIQKVSLLTYH